MRLATAPLAATLALSILTSLPTFADACPPMRWCSAPPPIVVAVVGASSVELVDMANASDREAAICEESGDDLASNAWHPVKSIGWSELPWFFQRMSRALQVRQRAEEARTHAAMYRSRATWWRARAARMRE